MKEERAGRGRSIKDSRKEERAAESPLFGWSWIPNCTNVGILKTSTSIVWKNLLRTEEAEELYIYYTLYSTSKDLKWTFQWKIIALEILPVDK